MKTLLNLSLPLWLAALLLGSLWGVNAYRHSRTVSRLTALADSLRLRNTELVSENQTLQSREQQIAIASQRRQLLDAVQVQLLKDSVSRLPLLTRIRYVYQTTGAAPAPPVYLLPAVSSRLTICYDTVAYRQLTLNLAELTWHRRTGPIRAEAEVRKDRIIAESAQSFREIAGRGWFRRRRAEAVRALNRIQVWARTDQVLTDSAGRIPITP
ncbi:hypothetical protein [Arsenicibacter rosenii]|uniref:Uncharacterized protein n=1 Tax=Arsenicibacter rosenii TaxID=1750698 RepID=A0A1S2VNT0_9BACT|nr:hypothetical protein [Arsenicibacter rosenii]OIN59826.1 hypothetical protein BLX24_08180 [Arsenicibacter rosenii]